MSISVSELSVAQLTQALDLRKRIDELKTQLETLLGGPNEPTGNGVAKPRRGRRRFSAAARRKMAEAQRKRWAAKRVETPKGTVVPTKRKRTMSAAGRAALSAAAKARWKK